MNLESVNTGVEINREEVESQAFNSMGYNDETETLELEFENKEVYRYWPVPRHIVEDIKEGEYPFRLSKSKSIGKAFHEYIRKDGELSFTRVGNAK